MNDAPPGTHAGAGTQDKPPLILLIGDEEWWSRALESILKPAGYVVLKAYNGRQGLERAVVSRPEAVLMQIELPDMTGISACRQLRADPRIASMMPIILTSADAGNRQQCVEALTAGASDLIGVPPDVYELLAKLRTWIGAKRGAELISTYGLLDTVTGVYNERGLLQRAQELTAEARRYERPLACVVFELRGVRARNESAEIDAAFLKRISVVLGSTLRTSDALGRLSQQQFAVLAPATDASGAVLLAQRALAALDNAIGQGRVDVHAGCYGRSNLRVGTVEPAELLFKAASALHAVPMQDAPEPRIHSASDDSQTTG